MIKAIVFDKDGTLLKYDDFWVPIAEAAAHDLLVGRGIDAAFLPELLASVGAYDGAAGLLCHGTYGEAAENMSRVLLAAVPTAAPFTAVEVAAAFEANMHRGVLVPACDDIAGLFARLRAAGLTLALVTSDNAPMTAKCLAALGLADAFDAVYTDDGEHPSKPDSYYMTRFCADFGVAPAEVLMVGDTCVDMDFAAASGAVAVGVADNERDAALIAPRAQVLLPHIGHIFEALAQANEA